jgi:hypothetical protein
MPKIVILVHLRYQYLCGIGNYISLQFLKPLFDHFRYLWLQYLEIDQVVLHSDSHLEMVCIQ